LLDPLLAFAIFVAIGLMRGYNFSTWLVTFLGGVGCVLPDLVEFIIRIFKIKSLTFFLKLHRAMHWFDKHSENIWDMNEDLNPYTKKRIFWGVVTQIPFVVASIYFLVR